MMSRIEVMPRLRCDRCGEVISETTLHGWLVLREGFGDVRHEGHFCTWQDLCESCFNEVGAFATNKARDEWKGTVA